MLLEDIVDYAIKGELSNLGVSNIGDRSDVTSDTEDANFKSVINYINRALTVIYTKFSLKEDKVIVDGVSTYPHTVSMPNDYLKLVDVRNVLDRPIPLRLIGTKQLRVIQDSHDVFSIHKDVDCILNEAETYPLTFNYQAKLPEYTADDMAVDIPLPHLVLEPLAVYIAYKAVSAMNTNENTTAASYLMRFNQLCFDIESGGIPINNAESAHKFASRGFV